MAEQRRLPDGRIIERLPDGTIREVPQAGMGGSVRTRPADPTMPYQGPKAGADLTGTNLTNTGKAIDNEVSIATKDALIRKAVADAAKAEADAATAAKGPVGAELQKSRAAQVQAARGLHNQLDRVEGLYDKNFRNNGIYSIAEFNPFSGANSQLDAASNVLMPFVKPLARTPGEGATDKSEYQDYRNLLPSGTSFDSTNDERILGLREMANSILRENGLPEYTRQGTAPTPQERDEDPMGALPNQGGGMGGGGPQGPDTTNPIIGSGNGAPLPGGFAPYGAKTRIEADPARAGLNSEVLGMIKGGVAPAVINQYIASRGGVPASPQVLQQAIAFAAKNPSWKGVDLETREVPMTGLQQFANNAPQTRLGTAATMAANAGGLGIPQMLAGDEGFDYLRAQNPGSALVGDVAGVIGGTSALGAVGGAAARRLGGSALLGGGKRAALGRQVATDATYGGIYGATTEGDPLSGALAATAGSLGGAAVGKGLQKTFAGGGTAAAQALRARGIPLTLGQAMGGMAQRVENAATTLPFVGDTITKRYGEGFDAFNREAFREGGSPIGAQVDEIGAAGLDALKPQIDAGYSNALQGANVPIDDPFTASMAQARAAGDNLPPDLKAKFDAALANRVDPMLAAKPPTLDEIRALADSRGVDLSVNEGPRGIKLSKIVAAERGQGNGSQIMDALTNYADVTGQRASLTPSTDFGASSVKRLQDYYSRFGFVKNAGRKKDFEISDGMYRDPSATAPLSSGPASIDGDQYQQAMRGLAGYKREMTKDGFEKDYRDALSGVQDSLKGVMMRNGGEGVVSGLGRADAAYRNSKVLGKAVNAARNGGRTGEVEMFSPSQLNDASAANAQKYGGNAATTNRPFYELATLGQKVLPSKLANSGTTERMLTGAGLLGTGTGASAYVSGADPYATAAPVATTSLLMLLGTKKGQQLLVKGLMGRPEVLKKVGGLFGRRKAQKLLATTGSGAALALGQ